MGMMDSLGLDEDTPIDAKILSNAVENAQKNVESRNFKVRKSVLEYDDVMNTQREVIYAQRKKVLDGESLRDNMMSILRTMVETSVTTAASKSGALDADAQQELLRQFEGVYFAKGAYQFSEKPRTDEVIEDFYALAVETYERKEAEVTPDVMRELERVIMLRVVDGYWMENIDAMDDLKQGIGLRAYAQHDPVIAYKEEGYEMFSAMIAAIREDTIRQLFMVRLKPTQEVKRQKVAKETGTGAAVNAEVKKQPVKKDKKPGPNDPCHCGSGLKYKKCCMQKDKA
jgi:preprotein translocase subunit SecA